MKIAVCDFRFHKGHRTFNSNVLDAVAELSGGNFIFFDNGNNYRYSDKYGEQRRLIINWNKEGNSPLKNRLNSRAYMKEEYKALNSEKCDTIICIAFDLLTFGFFGGKYFDKNIYLWHHAESDELSNNFKSRIFRKYMNKVKHIVHAPFIKDYLVHFGVEEDRIFVCPFVMTSDKHVNSNSKGDFYIAPSGSNDEQFCAELAEYEKNNEFFKNNKIRLVIKSFNTKFDNGYLKFYNEYLSFEEYEKMYSSAAAVVMPFQSSFRMRESGTIIDSLSSYKGVIASDIPIVRYYAQKCADVGEEGAVVSFKSIPEMCDIIKNYSGGDFPAVAQMMIAEHNVNALKNQLGIALKG